MPFVVHLKTERAERDPLIQFDMVADRAGLTNHHTGAMVDEKVVADRGPRMDINAGTSMGPFGHHPRNERNPKPIQFMGQAINRHRFQTRIAENHLVQALHRGIAIERRLGIFGQCPCAARAGTRGT